MFEMIAYIKSMLMLILAYLVSVTLAGFFKAWVTKKAGDYTAEHAGFLTLDPVVHIDPIGMLALLFVGIGWGRDIPINVFNVERPCRTAKIFSIFYTTTIVHTLIATSALLGIAGVNVLSLTTGHTAVLSVLATVLHIFFNLNLFLAMWRFIQNSVDLVLMDIIARRPEYALYIRLASIIVILLIFSMFGSQIRFFFAQVAHLLALGLLKIFRK